MHITHDQCFPGKNEKLSGQGISFSILGIFKTNLIVHFVPTLKEFSKIYNKKGY
jgi:hypothetical protein